MQLLWPRCDIVTGQISEMKFCSNKMLCKQRSVGRVIVVGEEGYLECNNNRFDSHRFDCDHPTLGR